MIDATQLRRYHQLAPRLPARMATAGKVKNAMRVEAGTQGQMRVKISKKERLDEMPAPRSLSLLIRW